MFLELVPGGTTTPRTLPALLPGLPTPGGAGKEEGEEVSHPYRGHASKHRILLRLPLEDRKLRG